MPDGELWMRMNAQPRCPVMQLSRHDVPATPGVYAWFRDGEPIYSGRAGGKAGLRGRIWGNHLREGADLSRSSFRRNVCDHLGIEPTARTRLRPTVMTPERVAPVNLWIRECEVAWIEFATAAEAIDFEKLLHAEWLPPLSRR